MRYLWYGLIALLALPASADWIEDWQQQQARTLRDWQAATVQLNDAVQQSCADGEQLDAPQRQALQPAWQRLARRWGAVASQAPAVIDELGLGYRVAFWPDSRGIVARQMRTHQQERSNGQYQDLQLAGQGIQGLDWMLAQPTPDCVLLSDWARHYAVYQTQILAELPIPLVPRERALTLAANDLYAQASRLNQRLREVLAEADGRYRPFMGDLSATGQSLTFIGGGLADLAERVLLLNAGFADDSQDQRARELNRQLTELAADLPDAWPAEDSQAAWALSQRIRAANAAVEDWLSEDVAQRYSLLIGFNNQDGD